MEAGIGEIVISLYRGSRDRPAPAFQDWALGQVQTLVPFRSAIWGRAGMENGAAHIYSVHLHRLPPESLESYERFKDRDVIGMMAMRRMGTTVLTSASQVLQDREMLDEHVRRFGLEHGLTTCLLDSRSGLLSFLTLFRPEGEPPFTEPERAVTQALAPHLIESCHQSRLMQLAAGDREGSLQGRAAACDTDFVLLAIREGFSEFMRTEWPGWSAPRLPESARAAIAAGSGRGRFVGERIVLGYERASDLYWLTVRDKSPADSLGKRQSDIARLTADGLTYKEVARTLGIAPATVRNHLDAIYKKLGIGSRGELATLLSRLD